MQGGRTGETGYVIIWVLIVIGLMTAAIGSIEFTVDTRPQQPGMFWAFGIGLAVAGLGLFLEGRQDFYKVAFFIAAAGLITAIITGAVAYFGEQRHPAAAATAVAMSLCAVGCVAYIVRTQMRPEALPNILRQKFHRGDIFEIDGVQFRALQSRTEVSAGESFDITVFAQNCWDAPRDFTFNLSQETRISLNKAGYLFDKAPKITLAPAEVVAMKVRAMAEPGAKGRYCLVASPKVSGTGGNRVRAWRAQAYQRPIPVWLTALGPFFGLIAWGGGFRFRTTVSPSSRPGAPQYAAPEVQAETVYRPDGLNGAGP